MESPPRKVNYVPRVGEGPHPCFCCGSAQYMWYHCSQKKHRKCAVCGSPDHYTRICSYHYVPATHTQVHSVDAREPADEENVVRNSGGTPCARPSRPTTAGAPTPGSYCDCPDDDRKDVLPDEVSMEHPLREIETLEAQSVLASSTHTLRAAALEILQANEDGSPTAAWCSCVQDLDFDMMLTVGKRIKPLPSPETGQLLYPVKYNGHYCTTLFDTGANRSFLSPEFADKIRGALLQPATSLVITTFQENAREVPVRQLEIARVEIRNLTVP